MKKQIKQQLEYFECYALDGPTGLAIEFIGSKVTRYTNEGWFDLHLDYSMGYDNSPEYWISGTRWETDEEESKREAKALKQKERNEANAIKIRAKRVEVEKKLYKKLKNKYEKS